MPSTTQPPSPPMPGAISGAGQVGSRKDPTRRIRAPRGSALNCRSWQTEAAFRMLQNNLDAEVAENPQELVVYGGIGRAARDWACYDRILEVLRELLGLDDQAIAALAADGVLSSRLPR